MFSMLTVGCISFSFFSPLAMPPLHKTVCSGASLVTGEYTEVAFMRVWTPIYVYPELYILFLFLYYFLFLFFVSLYFSLSRVWIWRQFIFFCFAWYINPICNSLYKLFQDFCRWDRYIWLLIFFFIFRLSMQYTHVIGELINSYARILSCVFWRQIQTEKKLSLYHL